MTNLNDSIASLKEKLQLLLKRFDQLEKENQQLKLTLSHQKEMTHLLEIQLKEGQSQWTASMLNKTNRNPLEKEKILKKIDQYINEIDMSIKQLNS
jgi:hypothetical protein